MNRINAKKTKTVKKSQPTSIENWKMITMDGINHSYEVSNQGRVRDAVTKQIVEQYFDKDGVARVTLY